MTLPRLDAIAAHWEKVPPLSVSAAAIARVLGVTNGAGVKKPEEKAKEKVQDMQGLFDLLGGSGGFGMEKPGWLKTTQ